MAEKEFKIDTWWKKALIYLAMFWAVFLTFWFILGFIFGK